MLKHRSSLQRSLRPVVRRPYLCSSKCPLRSSLRSRLPRRVPPYRDCESLCGRLLRSVFTRGWRNTVGNLIEIVWFGKEQEKENYHGPQSTGVRVNTRGGRFHRFRDFKQYWFNSILPTSADMIIYYII